MKKPKRKGPPSRLRYEKRNPTISCRVPRELYEQLRAVKKAEQGSFADILKMGLGLVEVQRRNEGEIRKAASEQGYKNGYAVAERHYKVTYACSTCGQPIELTSEEEKKDAASHMRERGWRHKECVNRSG